MITEIPTKKNTYKSESTKISQKPFQKTDKMNCDCEHGHHHHHHHDKYAIIRNPKSGLVLDASEEEVKIQHYTGFDAQLWRLEPLDDGKFLIINKCNDKVLDIQGGSKRGHKIITYLKHGGENQQWFVNSDHTIVNVSDELAIDIYKDHYHAGNHLVAWRKHGKQNQHFILQYQ